MPAPGSAAVDVDEPCSASAIIAGTVTENHLLHVEGYSRTKEDTPNGKCIKSCPFRVGGRSWHICYFPDGERSQYADYIAIFISLVESATKPVKARAKFSLMDQNDEPVPSHSRHILAARSPVFKAELLGAMREGTATGDCIRIDDLLPEVFKILLHFIYNDSLPEMEVQEEAAMAQHLLEVADRYDMQRLKLICEETLCNYLEVSMAAKPHWCWLNNTTDRD
ncbi:BTB/POZ and MATH domain-containing protein 3-like [Setaria italica]|uniref:BTB/POZ and MATH domain-containing protein 3-like n=1 Tax=Setaria italica TaxID=4555 RepID=UPI000350AB23|nr:BTB/POZ and MATH domain-containing protein 3-like [Setaria italica]